ncbi:hypothetical protein KAW08_03105 [bacterium]|nr:hypothetical protein [bacterium]
MKLNIRSGAMISDFDESIVQYTPKQRMLNAYRGIFSDRYPVAPEFWRYYPAKVLGVDMIEFEQIPHWQALQAAFKKCNCEGWGGISPDVKNPDVETTSKFEKISETEYYKSTTIKFMKHEFCSKRIYTREEPSWEVECLVKDEKYLGFYVDMMLSEKVAFDFSSVNNAYFSVGEDYLLELSLGLPFFDFIAGAMGFEKAVLYFMSGNDAILRDYRKRYINFNIEKIRQACKETKMESFFIGSSSSCNSLLGPRLWRQWDKPFIQAVSEEVHRQEKLLHIHFHGKSIETVADFVEIGIDAVCPFERPPGGDISDLSLLRKLLGGKVAMNGNVHTVETLIRGSAEDVKREVREIKDAFVGEPRLIIGTGDQVGKETPEENIFAMIETARSTRR